MICKESFVFCELVNVKIPNVRQLTIAHLLMEEDESTPTTGSNK